VASIARIANSVLFSGQWKYSGEAQELPVGAQGEGILPINREVVWPEYFAATYKGEDKILGGDVLERPGCSE
jgi:hypothetical protein